MALGIALTGCGSGQHPSASSTAPPTSKTSAVTSSPRAAVSTKTVFADTVAVGSTGLRCFVGNNSTACASARPFKDGDYRYWTMVLSLTAPTDLEPGFQPGDLVAPTELTVGDIAVTGGTVGIITTAGADLKVGVRDQEVGVREIADSRPDFDGFFRPRPGRQVSAGQPVTIRDWTFTLKGTTLTVTTPNGATDIDI